MAGALASVVVLARGSRSTPGSEENLLLEMVLATFLDHPFIIALRDTDVAGVPSAVIITAVFVLYIVDS